MSKLVKEIRPQDGMQSLFLSTPADIALGGGIAGSGKTYALLMEPMRHISNPKFSCIIFRRTYPQIINEGGLWDTSAGIYPFAGGIPKATNLEWEFKPYGSTVRFSHMQYEHNRFQWDGAQIPLIAFDQVEHFTARSFWYMLSRNRSEAGIHSYIRMTANPPGPDHWLRAMVDWWIDAKTGLPIEERSGAIRWFVRIGNEIIWASSKEGLISGFGPEVIPKSFTFIRGRLSENKILLKKDSNYVGNLQALQKVDRERLLYGNWNVRDNAGMFSRSWFEVLPAATSNKIDTVRYWDRAASTSPSASWTAGVKIGKDKTGGFEVIDVVRFKGTPGTVQNVIKNVASQDGTDVRIGIEQDPGQAGKAEAQGYVRLLPGFSVSLNAVHDSKGTRAKPFSAQAEVGNVKLVKGTWNSVYLDELESFDGSNTCFSDQVDASSGAFYLLTQATRAGVWGR